MNLLEKKQKYLVRQPKIIDEEIYDDDNDQKYIYVDKSETSKPPASKKTTKKVGLSNYIK